MVPDPSLLADVLPTDRLNERAKPRQPLRGELRHFSNARNAVTVARRPAPVVRRGHRCGLDQHVVVVRARPRPDGARSRLSQHPRSRGRPSAAVHQSPHERRGRPLAAGLPDLSADARLPAGPLRAPPRRDGPRRAGPLAVCGYPIPRDSWRRKLRRDATGNSAYKNFKGLWYSLRHGRVEARYILAVHVVMLGASIVFMRPLAYVVWIVSWSTLWKVSNRLRSIAEHGGMVRSKDRRLTTHVIRQTPSGALLDGSVQHRLAPRPSRRHGCAVAQSAAAARRTGARRAGSPRRSSIRAIGRSGAPPPPAHPTDPRR